MGQMQSCFHRFLKRQQSSSGEHNPETEAVKQYSWDQRRKDATQYIIENATSQELGRLPGQIDGEQFMIRNCDDTSVYLFDHINTITIDDCKGCKFFVGPTKGSIFIRDCSDCVVVTACGQFRTRDCKDLTVFLCCSTQPIIEASTGIKFGCFQYHYADLEKHFHAASLSPFNNFWWHIHDFTPVPGEQNWKLIGECYQTGDFLEPPKKNDALRTIEVDTQRKQSVVPYTIGTRRRDHDETSLTLVFHDPRQVERARLILAELDKFSEIELIKTRQIQLEESDAERIFGNKQQNNVCGKGELIALQYGGPDCVQVCEETAKKIGEATAGPGLIYASPTLERATMDIHNLFNFASMQLGI